MKGAFGGIGGAFGGMKGAFIGMRGALGGMKGAFGGMQLAIRGHFGGGSIQRCFTGCTASSAAMSPRVVSR